MNEKQAATGQSVAGPSYETLVDSAPNGATNQDQPPLHYANSKELPPLNSEDSELPPKEPPSLNTKELPPLPPTTDRILDVCPR